MIGIIDYGIGNLNAFFNALTDINVDAKIITRSCDFQKVAKLILPGVGSFDSAISKLNDSGLKEELEYQVLNKGKPILGVCSGMQIMFESSEEGKLNGLGWINGCVKRLQPNDSNYPIPHMGWNSLKISRKHEILKNLNDQTFYFLHSFFVLPDDNSEILTYTDYKTDFCSLIAKKNIYGSQFHPEKSNNAGRVFLKNFSTI